MACGVNGVSLQTVFRPECIDVEFRRRWNRRDPHLRSAGQGGRFGRGALVGPSLASAL